MNRHNKFVGQPRHALDLRFQKKVGRRLDALLNAQIQDERGNVIGTVEYADGNTILKFNSSSSAGAAVKAFVITEIGHSKYFIARELSNVRTIAGVDQADVGSTDFTIAKPPRLRRSVTSELIDGFSFTYADKPAASLDNERIANDGAKDEDQVVYPRYITLADLGYTNTVPVDAQCVIYAIQTSGVAGVVGPDGKTLDWIEILPARVWAKRYAA